MRSIGVTFVSSEKFDTCGNEALGGAAFAEGVLFLAAAVLREENGVAKADAFFHNRLSEVRIRRALFFLGFIRASLIGQISQK